MSINRAIVRSLTHRYYIERMVLTLTTDRFDRLRTAARGYYYALITGYPLEAHIAKLRKEIAVLQHCGVKQDMIEEVLYDVAFSIC